MPHDSSPQVPVPWDPPPRFVLVPLTLAFRLLTVTPSPSLPTSGPLSLQVPQQGQSLQIVYCLFFLLLLLIPQAPPPGQPVLRPAVSFPGGLVFLRTLRAGPRLGPCRAISAPRPTWGPCLRPLQKAPYRCLPPQENSPWGTQCPSSPGRSQAPPVPPLFCLSQERPPLLPVTLIIASLIPSSVSYRGATLHLFQGQVGAANKQPGAFPGPPSPDTCPNLLIQPQTAPFTDEETEARGEQATGPPRRHRAQPGFDAGSAAPHMEVTDRSAHAALRTSH